MGLIQGIISGLLLFILNKQENRSTLFLGIFILAFSIDYITPISKLLKLTIDFPNLNLLFDFRWLLFPLFYIYVRQVSILPKSKKIYYFLIPWLVMFIFNTIIFLTSIDVLERIHNSLLFQHLYLYGSTIFDIFITVKIVTFIDKHSIETRSQYSSTINKELKWAKYFVLSGILFILVMHIRHLIKNPYLNFLEAIINVSFLYWVSIHGLRQQNIVSLIPQNDGNINPNIQKRISEKDILLVEKINHYIQEKKAYLNPSLTITDVSNSIKKQPKEVSVSLNLVIKKNFKSYINSFRVIEAKELLKNESKNHFSVEGIGLEVGFKSKSVFYAAFKKETGLTPNQFRLENKNNTEI